MAWLCMMPLRRRRSMPECFGMHSGAVTVIIRGFVIGENRMADGAQRSLYIGRKRVGMYGVVLLTV